MPHSEKKRNEEAKIAYNEAFKLKTCWSLSKDKWAKWDAKLLLSKKD